VRASRRSPSRFRSLRRLAERKVATSAAASLDRLTPAEVRALVHELEIHKVELEIQNQQLTEAQLTLEESRERYRRLYDLAPIGYLTLDPEGAIVEANLGASLLLSVPRSRLLGRKLSRFVAPRHQDRWHLERRALARGAKRRTLELELVLADGSALHTQLVGTGTPGKDGVPGPLRIALLDVTELHSLGRALQMAVSAASLAEQRERRALASDLHDGAGQLLSLASLKLRALGEELGDKGRARIQDLEELLAETRRQVSSLSFQLSPPLLHDVGFVAAAQWLAEEKKRRFDLVVHVAKGEELELDEATRVTLFRALRELLLNVSKHSHVGEAHVRIWRDGELARLAVEDFGVGFDPEAGHRGFGLLTLHDRVTQMGGSVEIGSVLGSGTRVVVSVPCTSRGGDGEGGSA
jgi:two-component system sensor histidine kinase UhpB